MLRTIPAVLLFVGSIAGAQIDNVGPKHDAPKGRVSKIIAKTKRVDIEFASGTKNPGLGGQAQVTTSSGQTCPGPIVGTIEETIRVDLSECAAFADIKEGDPGEISSTTSPKSASGDAEKKNDAKESTSPAEPFIPGRVRIGLGVYMNTANKLSFYSSTGNAGTSFVYDVGPAFGALVEMAYLEKNSWGFNANISLETERNFQQVEVKSSSGTTRTDMSASGTNLNFTFVSANLLYRWDDFYLPFGINIGSPQVKNPPLALRSLQGGAGYQLGMGVVVDDLAFEVLYKTISVVGEMSTSGSSQIQLGAGSLNGLELVGKIYF